MKKENENHSPVGDPLPGKIKKNEKASPKTLKPHADKPGKRKSSGLFALFAPEPSHASAPKKRAPRLEQAADKPGKRKSSGLFALFAPEPSHASAPKKRAPRLEKEADKPQARSPQKHANRLTPAFVTRLFIAITASVLLIAVVLLTATRYLRKDTLLALEADTPVALVEFAPLSVFAAQFDTLPEATPAPAPVPDGALDVLVDGVPVFALYSRAEAERVLTTFLDMSAVAPEGELFLSASYECEIQFAAASGNVPLLDENAALTLLLSEPSLVPVTMKTERRTVDIGAAQRSEQSDALLAKGEHFIVQLGTGARTATRMECTYVGGTFLSASDPLSEVVTAARTTLIKNGTYRAKDPNGEPEDDEGKMGKSAGDLTWVKPMSGAYASYFGTRRGKMHSGVDISAKAGSAIVAPAEGVVIFCAERGDYGFTVDIDHGNGFVSRLTHLEGVSLMLHQRVFRGDAIGTLAATADGGTPHLHYELIIDGIPVNPLYYLP